MGEWAILWGIPSLLWAIEQILTGAGTSRLIHFQSKAKNQEANILFHNLLYLQLILALFLALLGLICCLGLPVAGWLNFNFISGPDAQHISAVLLGYMALVLFSNVIRMPFAAVGSFWIGNLHASCTQAMLFITQITLLKNQTTAHPITLAWGVFMMQTLCLGVLLLLFFVFCKPFTLGWRRPSRESLSVIMQDNLPLVGYAFSQSLLTQGFSLSIQLSLGPTFVAAFGTLRTLCRTFYQGSQIILSSTSPELAGAVARRDFTTIRKIRNLQLCLILTIFCFFTWMALKYHTNFLEYWSHGRFSFSNFQILIVLVGILLQVLWSRIGIFLMAALKHKLFYALILIVSVFYVGGLFFIRNRLDFNGFFIALFAYDFIIYLLSFAQAKSLLKNLRTNT